MATEIAGDGEFPPTILIQPFDLRGIVGIDPVSIRVFRWDEKLGTLRPVWNSGVNLSAGHTWAKIQRPGLYVPIGLPRDRVLQSMIQVMAVQRQYADPASPGEARALADATFDLLFQAPEGDLALLRQLLANLEVQSSVRPIPPRDLVMGNGGHIMALALPGGASLPQFKERLKGLKAPATGLPEGSAVLSTGARRRRDSAPPASRGDRVAPWKKPISCGSTAGSRRPTTRGLGARRRHLPAVTGWVAEVLLAVSDRVAAHA